MSPPPKLVDGVPSKHHPLYQRWRSMRKRCSDPATNGYERYGGRGISVCAEWVTSFASFVRDVGIRPSQRHTLDRINGNGNYEPGNVRWATPSQQALNREHREQRGEANSSSRLSLATVMEIRAAVAAKTCSQNQIAKRFGVAPSHVSNIVRGRSWASTGATT